MICKNYDSLSHVQKIVYVGELLHSCQSDNELFLMGLALIDLARQKGLLDGVVILPNNEQKNYEICPEKQTE
jgi:hypothetical protein